MLVKKEFLELDHKIGRWIDVETTKKRALIGIVVLMVLAVVLNIMNQNAQVNEVHDYQFSTIAAVIIIGFFAIYRVTIKPKHEMFGNLCILVCAVFMTQQMTQIAYNAPIITKSAMDSTGMGQFFLGLACIAFVYLVLYAIIGRWRWSLILGAILFFALSVTNYYVILFRGDPFYIGDMMSLDTGAEVMGGYQIIISGNVMAAMLMLAAILVTVWHAKDYPCSLSRKIKRRGLSVFIAVYAMLIFINSQPEKIYDSWEPTNNQYITAFFTNVKLQYVPSPEGYTSQEVKTIVDEHQPEEKNEKTGTNTQATGDDNGGTIKTNSKKPTIIVVMNESFSDPAIIGDFETNEDYMPFVHSLSKNTTKGKLYVDVLGGGTCNTEYSFLTGNSTAFVPQNARPYQMYVNSDTSSLAKNLKSQGYDTYAMHPGESFAWNRENVYRDFGFDESFFAEESYETLEMTRQFVSDQSTYSKIIQLYQNRGDDPQFIFDVTIANHGGYNIGTEGLDQIKLEGCDQNYPDVEEYLTLIKKSDKEIQNLVEYFSEESDPVAIVFFGDHQPNLDENFFGEIKNKPVSEWTNEELQMRYITPFFIWTNYDSKEESDVHMSVNYLQETVLNKLGLQTTAYDNYQKDIFSQMPVVDTKGVIDGDGQYQTLEQALKSNNVLQDYQKVLYNNMFDSKNRCVDLYNLPETK